MVRGKKTSYKKGEKTEETKVEEKRGEKNGSKDVAAPQAQSVFCVFEGPTPNRSPSKTHVRKLATVLPASGNATCEDLMGAVSGECSSDPSIILLSQEQNMVFQRFVQPGKNTLHSAFLNDSRESRIP